MGSSFPTSFLSSLKEFDSIELIPISNVIFMLFKHYVVMLHVRWKLSFWHRPHNWSFSRAFAMHNLETIAIKKSCLVVVHSQTFSSFENSVDHSFSPTKLLAIVSCSAAVTDVNTSFGTGITVFFNSGLIKYCIMDSHVHALWWPSAHCVQTAVHSNMYRTSVCM